VATVLDRFPKPGPPSPNASTLPCQPYALGCLLVAATGRTPLPDLDQMVRRQRILADFGDFALESEDLDEVLMEACRLVGDALGTDLAKVLEIEGRDGTRVLFARAGVGWPPLLSARFGC